MQQLMIGVIGAGAASPAGYETARRIGRLIAKRKAVLVCGGLGGVMEASCRGALESGGQTLGLLPGAAAEQANPYVTLVVPTNLGHARNVLIAHTARALIAVEGEYGTLSEMAIALKLGRPVAALQGWPDISGVFYASSAEEAVDHVFACLGQAG
jgi:hypothetical protein